MRRAFQDLHFKWKTEVIQNPATMYETNKMSMGQKVDIQIRCSTVR